MLRSFIFVLTLFHVSLVGAKRITRLGTWGISVPPWAQVSASGAYTGGMTIEFYKEVARALSNALKYPQQLPLLLQMMARAGFDPVIVPLTDPFWSNNLTVANGVYLDQGKIDVAFEISETPGNDAGCCRVVQQDGDVESGRRVLRPRLRGLPGLAPRLCVSRLPRAVALSQPCICLHRSSRV